MSGFRLVALLSVVLIVACVLLGAVAAQIARAIVEISQ
jgi:hypothetical protein